MSDIGGGIGLTDDWDFEVDSTGDISSTTGIAELEKDVAFSVTRTIQPSIGQRIDDGTAKELEIAVQDALLSDSRINSVRSVTVRRIGLANTFEVVADANTDDGPFELVFEVSL